MITMVDKRVAKALVVAVQATQRQIAICQVVMQAERQGLVPSDFDTPYGTDALVAIAIALTALPSRSWARWKSKGDVWKGAVRTALDLVHTGRQTDRQARAYAWRLEVERRRKLSREATATTTSP